MKWWGSRAFLAQQLGKLVQKVQKETLAEVLYGDIWFLLPQSEGTPAPASSFVFPWPGSPVAAGCTCPAAPMLTAGQPGLRCPRPSARQRNVFLFYKLKNKIETYNNK